MCGTNVDCRDLGRTCGLSKRYQPVRSCTFTPYAVTDYEYDPEVPPQNNNSPGFLNTANNNLLYIKENTNNETIGFYSDLNEMLMKFKNDTLIKNKIQSINLTKSTESTKIEEDKTTLKPNDNN